MVAREESEVRRTKDRLQGSGAAALATCVAFLTLMSGCRKWDNPLDPVGNRPPTVPSYPRPADSGLGRDSGLVLAWHSFDPDEGDTAYFDIFLGTASPPVLVQTAWTDTTFQPTSPASPAEYHWRVIAYDNHGDSAVGPLWQFQTAVPITVSAPDSGDRLRMYTTDTVVWTGGPTASDSAVLYQSADDGASWNRLGKATISGQFIWQVPAPATESARVRVRAYVATDTMTGMSRRFAIEDTL